jgi:hypothetical protein
MEKTLSGSRAVGVAVVSEVVLAGSAFSGDQGVAAAATNATTIEPTSHFRYVDDCASPEGIGDLDVHMYSHEYVAQPGKESASLVNDFSTLLVPTPVV